MTRQTAEDPSASASADVMKDDPSLSATTSLKQAASSPFKAYLRLLRPSDWLKNLLVLTPLVFGSRLNQGNAFAHALLAACAFTLVASGFYAINDALDFFLDQAHPLKRRRPVAAGAVSRAGAWRFGTALAAAGIALGFVVSTKLGAICLTYALLQIAYNAKLKRVAIYDVAFLSFGFVLRAGAGAAAIGARMSVWFILGVYWLCLYLAFIKRLSDLTTARRQGAQAWRSPAGYDDIGELNWNSAVAGALTLGTYLAYTLSEHAQKILQSRAMVFALLTPVVLVAMQRLYRRAKEGWSDRPLDAFVQDRGFRYSLLAYAACVMLTLYPPHLGDWVARFFQP